MLRQLKLEDWQIYKEIRLECIQNTPWAFGARYADEVLKDDIYWQDTINNPRRMIFGIFDNDKIIAIAGLSLPDTLSKYATNQKISSSQITVNNAEIEPEKWFIVSVYCTPQYRGQGYVEKILNYLITHHQQNYSGSLYLSVEVNNIRAIKLYQKLGFVIVEKLPPRIMGDCLLHEEYLMQL